MIVAGPPGDIRTAALLAATSGGWPRDLAVICVDPSTAADLAFWRAANPRALAMVEAHAAKHGGLGAMAPTAFVCQVRWWRHGRLPHIPCVRDTSKGPPPSAHTVASRQNVKRTHRATPHLSVPPHLTSPRRAGLQLQSPNGRRHRAAGAAAAGGRAPRAGGAGSIQLAGAGRRRRVIGAGGRCT